jgi:predicted transcriptional regulator YdeE
MQKTRLSLPEIKLVGLSVRTSNTIENPASSKIGPCVQKYVEENFPAKIPHRKNKGRTFCAYSHYESDYTGEYTFYIGEEVESFGELTEGLVSHIIPSQTDNTFWCHAGCDHKGLARHLEYVSPRTRGSTTI